MGMRIIRGLAVGALAATLASGSVLADEAGEEAPAFEFAAEVDIGYFNTYSSDDDAAELSDLIGEGALDLRARLGAGFSINAGFVLEPSVDPVDDRVFEDHGLFMEQLFLQYEADRFSLLGGKFNAAFGSAYEATPSVFNDDFTADYELAEAVGASGSLVLIPGWIGHHDLTLSVFFFDNTILSETLGEERFERSDGSRDSRNRREYGGLGNTEGPSSVALALSSEDLFAIDGLTYNLGFHSLNANNNDEEEDQTGWVAGLQYEIGLAEDVSLTPFIEYALLEDFEGTLDRDAHYLTLAAALKIDSWTLAPAYVTREFSDPALDDDGNAIDPHDHQVSFTVDYEFDVGLTARAAWKTEQVAGIDADTVAVRLVYAISNAEE